MWDGIKKENFTTYAILESTTETYSANSNVKLSFTVKDDNPLAIKLLSNSNFRNEKLKYISWP